MLRILMFPTCRRCIVASSYFYHNNNIMSIIKQFASLFVTLNALTRHCRHIDHFSHFCIPPFFVILSISHYVLPVNLLFRRQTSKFSKREFDAPRLPEKLIFLYTITSSPLIHQLVKFNSFITTGTFRTI